MKKIAVIVSGIDEEYQNTILRGVCDCAEEAGASVLHFVSFGGILHNARHDAGENNIYRLCNYHEVDGVVLLTNTICDHGITAEIVQDVQCCNVPVVSIDNDLDVRFFHIGIDNYKAMREIAEHIVDFHHCRNIGYISGPETNPESIQRFRAVEDLMRERELPFEKEQVYYGGFRSVDGRDGAMYFMNRPEGLPEAIICANDAMALSAVLTLEENGVKVPDQVKVTGFDNIYAARNFDPDITSVERPLYKSGYLAAKRLLGMCPPEADRSLLVQTKCVFRKSCGCPSISDTPEGVRDFRRCNLRQLNYYQDNIPLINRMSCQLAESDSFEENMDTLKDFIKRFTCQRFYLCLNDNWNTVCTKRDEEEQKVRLADSFRSKGYTEMMEVPLAYINGEFRKLPAFPTAQMLPDAEKELDQPMVYYFLPMHFRDRGFGYCVLCSQRTDLETPLLHSWAMNIANSLESIRKMQYLDRAMSELDQLYVMDNLCRINNRNGFNKYSVDIFEDCRKNHRNVMMMFIDMDGLKYINDTFSHAEGDNALKQLARTIKLSCKNGEVFARFGGDEFIIFAPEYSEEAAQKLSQQMQDRMDEYNRTSGKPYKVGASVGWHICEVDEDSELYPLITAADKKMYEQKKRKRVSRYLRHDS